MIRALLHTAIFLTRFVKSWSLLLLTCWSVYPQALLNYIDYNSVISLTSSKQFFASNFFFQPPFHWFVEPLTMLLIRWSCHGPIFLRMTGKLNHDSMNFNCHFWAQTLSLSHLKVHFLGNFSQAQTLFHTGFSPMCCRLEKVSDVRTQGPVDGGGR